MHEIEELIRVTEILRLLDIAKTKSYSLKDVELARDFFVLHKNLSDKYKKRIVANYKILEEIKMNKRKTYKYQLPWQKEPQIVEAENLLIALEKIKKISDEAMRKAVEREPWYSSILDPESYRIYLID